jgi:hypothetical protein
LRFQPLSNFDISYTVAISDMSNDTITPTQKKPRVAVLVREFNSSMKIPNDVNNEISSVIIATMYVHMLFYFLYHNVRADERPHNEWDQIQFVFRVTNYSV